MSFIAQIDQLGTALRLTRQRMLAPVDTRQLQLPRDPEIFVDDVIHFMMDQWAVDLRADGHVLEQDHGWKDRVSHYPKYDLRMMGSKPLAFHFTGAYPGSLFLTISRGQRDPQQFSDAKQVTVELPITMDPNALLHTVIDGLKRYGKV